MGQGRNSSPIACALHLDTQFVVEQFDISRRRVQQLAKTYRETGEIPELETPGRNNPYADHPKDFHVRILEFYERYDQGATVIAKLLRIRDGITVDNNTVHAILQE